MIEIPKNAPTFGYTLLPKQAKMLSRLPKEQLDVFERQMQDAPMGESTKDSKARDRILNRAFRAARNFIIRTDNHDT